MFLHASGHSVLSGSQANCSRTKRVVVRKSELLRPKTVENWDGADYLQDGGIGLDFRAGLGQEPFFVNSPTNWLDGHMMTHIYVEDILGLVGSLSAETYAEDSQPDPLVLLEEHIKVASPLALSEELLSAQGCNAAHYQLQRSNV